MTTKITKEEIYTYLQSWAEYDSKQISEEGEAYKTTVSVGIKKLIITTPYEVAEFYLEFYVNEEACYSDWYEIMDDNLSDFMEYTKMVMDRFLFNEIRVKTSGWWIFKVSSLEFCKNEVWQNVFTPQT